MTSWDAGGLSRAARKKDTSQVLGCDVICCPDEIGNPIGGGIVKERFSFVLSPQSDGDIHRLRVCRLPENLLLFCDSNEIASGRPLRRRKAMFRVFILAFLFSLLTEGNGITFPFLQNLVPRLGTDSEFFPPRPPIPGSDSDIRPPLRISNILSSRRQSSNPQSSNPQSSNPQSSNPQSSDPQSSRPQSSNPPVIQITESAPFDLHESMTQLGLDIVQVLTTGEKLRQCVRGDRKGKLPADSTGNVLISPLSISSALSMLWLGAEGDTGKEIKAALRYPANEDERNIHDAYNRNLTALLRPDRGVTLNYSNTLFGNIGLSVILYYYEDVQTYYKSTIRGVDFKNPVKAREHINRWVGNQTDGRIKDILSQPPSPDTNLMIANAIYFKGNWAYPFPEKDTQIDTFTVSPNEVLRVPIMNNVMEIPFARDDKLGVSVIALPYDKFEMSLYILLPFDQGVRGLQELESRLDARSLDTLVRSMNVSTVTVAMPRFSMEYKTDLRSVLGALGVCDLFSPASADLRDIAVNETLYVDEVLHQANVEVNEKGTVAAAATIAGVSRTFRSFRVDRPFIFFIKDNPTGLPLFWGRVIRPQTS
ncbi:unnamed protein product [Darwinula stevensoni]|uniref:Serpin domain-containing protein n=1 Tax=Darwinula stevensoni TaxID=69355 RepID=A0A7R9FPQ0_9CRUS|nr:unnamed protein product [Darwinula stevensoni]CAG0898318.1 unnamed protein product [Darwinula stevensoni]